jgi:SAM-dependent methyltransferase
MAAWIRSGRQYHWGLLVAASLLAVCAHAQAPATQEFQPMVGQSGKDVVWVPSPQALVDKMLDMAKVTPADFVMDLGSGDGRTVITAARRGARAMGVEYNPDMVALSRRNAAAAGAGDKATFVQADIFQTDISRATVITLFLLTDLNLKLRPAILSLKPGTRIVSNTFKMGEWEPDQSFELGCDAYCTAYLWIVPARVEGKWQFGKGELVLKQSFQKVTGTLSDGGSALPIANGRLDGSEISFVAGGSEYRGRVTGKAIEGTVRNGAGSGPWSARR